MITDGTRRLHMPLSLTDGQKHNNASNVWYVGGVV